MLSALLPTLLFSDINKRKKFITSMLSLEERLEDAIFKV